MSYRIIYLAGGNEVGATPWTGALVSAKQHAEDHMENASQHGATRVEVRAEDGTLMFARPPYADGGGATLSASKRHCREDDY
jgi:hypothetical protein